MVDMENLLVMATAWTGLLASNDLVIPDTKNTHNEQIIYSTDLFRKPNKRKIALQKRLLAKKIKKQIQRNVDKVLVFAPHPDDEVLCCGLTLTEKIKQGSTVKIVFVTNGDAKSFDFDISKSYGRLRKSESIKSAIHMGIPIRNLIFLNFPDGYLDKLDMTTPITSSYTGENVTHFSSYFPGRLYTKKALKSSIREILIKEKPHTIYFPDPQLDKHPDHAAVGQIVMDIITEDGLKLDTQAYQIHGTKKVAALSLPNRLKLELIKFFPSQFHSPEYKKFMEHFASLPEVFKGSSPNSQ